jgi:diguanylate cyclase (GGDEF)-like protein
MQRIVTSVELETTNSIIREQAIFIEFMMQVCTNVEIMPVLDAFLIKTLDLVRADHGCFLFLKRETTDEYKLQIFVNTFEETPSYLLAEELIKGVLRNPIRNLTPLVMNEAAADLPPTSFGVKNVIAVSVPSADGLSLGVVMLMNKAGGFTEEDTGSLFNFLSRSFQAIAMKQQMLFYATTDTLTGLRNYRVFMERLDGEINRANRYSRDVSLLMIDIDNFKSFNDLYGHQSGDFVLKSVGDIIRRVIRNTDTGARYGGEEFAVILPETSSSEALIVAERLRQSIGRELILHTGEKVYITVSVGYATYPQDADTRNDLIKKSDEGLYVAKETGRNRVCKYSDILETSRNETSKEIYNILADISIKGIRELAKAADSKCNYMKGHSFDVAALAAMIGRRMSLSGEHMTGLVIGGLLHDVGNLSIPEYILNKPGPLTVEERHIVQAHPGLSETLLKNYVKSETVLSAVLHHHESFDGTGYPLGLRGDDIPLHAKILAVVEAYHAMISPRPYRKRKSVEEAMSEIQAGAEKQFDPSIAGILLNMLRG